MPKVADPDAPATNANGSTPRKAPGPRVPVQWGLRPVASFPEGTGNQRGEVYNLIKQVEANPTLHGQAIELGTYEDDERAKASANNKVSGLRKAAKDANKPWEFAVAASQVEPGRVAIVGRYKAGQGAQVAPQASQAG